MVNKGLNITKGRYRLVATNPYTLEKEVFDFEIGDFLPENNDTILTSIAEIDKVTTVFCSEEPFLSHFNMSPKEREELPHRISIEYKSHSGLVKSLEPIWDDKELSKILEYSKGGNLDLKNIYAYNRFYEMIRTLKSSSELYDLLLDAKDTSILLNDHSKESVRRVKSHSFWISDLSVLGLANNFSRYREYRALHIACRRYEKKKELQKENQGKKRLKSL